jgi:hypothetical protein
MVNDVASYAKLYQCHGGRMRIGASNPIRMGSRIPAYVSVRKTSQ